VKPHG
jgi:hypothetical protein